MYNTNIDNKKEDNVVSKSQNVNMNQSPLACALDEHIKVYYGSPKYNEYTQTTEQDVVVNDVEININICHK